MTKSTGKRTKEQYATRSGPQHHAWKGEAAGYVSLHEWVYRNLGSPSKGEIRGCSEKPAGKKRWFEWSSKDRKYQRDISTWWALCIPCHRKYDKWREKIKKKFMEKKPWLKLERDPVTGRFSKSPKIIKL